jgi:hypothetical protein
MTSQTKSLVAGDQFGSRPNARSIFAMALVSVVSARTSCSHILTTLTRACARARLTARPRAIFRAIFASQYALCCLGIRKQFLQPCQKHPSTKTATLFLANQKSGTPGNSWACNFQPRMRARTSLMRKVSSVDRFPLERTLLICRLRSDFDSMSMDMGLHEPDMGAR